MLERFLLSKTDAGFLGVISGLMFGFHGRRAFGRKTTNA